MAAPSNDNFASPLVIEVANATVKYTSPQIPNTEATTEPGEPTVVGSNSKSVWWSYTPTANGTATFDTVGSFDIDDPDSAYANTGLAVWTGASLGALTLIGYDADSGASYGGKTWTSWLQVTVTAGTTYWIQVGSTYDLTYVLNATGPASVTGPPSAPAVTLTQVGTTLNASWPPHTADTWETRLDGGTWVAKGTATSHGFTGLTPGTTHTVEVRGTNSYGVGAVGSASRTLTTQVLFDSYDRANSTSVPGSPQHGPAPVVRSGTWGISGNRLYASSAGSSPTYAILTYDIGTPDFDATFTRESTSDHGGFVFGYVSQTNYWYLCPGDQVYESSGLRDYWLLWKAEPGGLSLQVEAQHPIAEDGYPVRVTHRSGVVRVYAGTKELFVDPIPVTSTIIGFRATATSTRIGRVTVDQFTAADAMPRTDGVMAAGNAIGAGAPVNEPGFIYEGGDTATADSAGVRPV